MMDHDGRDSSLKYEADQPDDQRAMPEASHLLAGWPKEKSRNRPPGVSILSTE